jgi:hypothetical protein
LPIAVLNPSDPGALSLSGNSTIVIVGGPTRGISVNSSSATAATLFDNAAVNLSRGGPNQTGSDLGVTGGAQISSNGSINFGTTGHLAAPATPIGDPYSQIAAPNPASLPNGTSTHVANGVNGCPVASGCTEYTAGKYPTGISVQLNDAAIFDPGAYYITGGMSLAGNSCARPSTAAGDGSGGTMFYFSDSNSISVAGNSGVACGAAFSSSRLNCPGNSSPLPTLPLTGDVFLAPCSGPFGDPLGASDPDGQQRGIVFFQNRSKSANPSLGGNGSVLTVGTLYFHQCVTSGSDTGTGCSSSAYNTVLTLAGNSASSSMVLGDIVADNISMGGNSGITMNLNPASFNSLLKAGLLR